MAKKDDKKTTTEATTSTIADIAGKKKAPRVQRAKVFRVVNEKSKTAIYVKAFTRARSLSFAAESVFKSALATADELIAAGRDGIEILDATTEVEE